MDAKLHKYGQWALVAGAAEGIGEAFCRSLASRGINIVMVDHNHNQMDELSDELVRKFNIETKKLHLDLADSNASKGIIKAIKDIDCRLLIYVAAFSKVKKFVDLSESDLDKHIDVNTHTPLRLIHSFSKDLIDKKQPGGIIIISSLAAMWGTQLVASYGATKAFDLILAEALHHELKEHQIDVLACVAGATETPAYLASNPQYGFIKPKVQKPEQVSEKAIKSIGKKAICISGFQNRLTVFIFTKLFPRKTATAVFNSTMKRMYLN